MKGRLWILIALAAVALLVARTPVFRDPARQSSSVAGVFDTVLQQRYPGWTGVRQCVTSPEANHDICWAELHRGNRYRQVEIGIDLATSTPVPSAATLHDPWTRKRVHVNTAVAHAYANTLAYDWGYLIRVVQPGQLPVSILAVDGDPTGYAPALFTFRCTGTANTISCRNAAGDTITYSPIV